MYHSNMKRRNTRIQAQVHVSLDGLPTLPEPLFGPTFMDNIHIDYPAQDFGDIQWAPQLREPTGWELRAS